jgi:hypothetical protein
MTEQPCDEARASGAAAALQQAEEQRMAEAALDLWRRMVASKNPEISAAKDADSLAYLSHELVRKLIRIAWRLKPEQADLVFQQACTTGHDLYYSISELHRTGEL